MDEPAVVACHGPPPRVWGKLIGRGPFVGFSWSTPTRVGKTIGILSIRNILIGPPPRVWGKPFANTDNRLQDRSTPTRVGKTTVADGVFRVLAVHPHACGENLRPGTRQTSSLGPPPRVWGKQRGRQNSGGGQLVHPHACGENERLESLMGYSSGPPPRVWGKLYTYHAASQLGRSTPTRVGKTAMAAPIASIFSVHPHACGENLPPG